MGRRIEDYALIGDTQSAALVSRSGSIDWLCLPRFDSGACFAALLGTERHGRWSIAPAGDPGRVTRRYRPGTLVLETTFETPTGSAVVIDAMPPRTVLPEVVRVVRGLSGRVAMAGELAPRFDYGSILPWTYRPDGRWRAVAGPDALTVDAPRGVEIDERGRSAFEVGPGDERAFVLIWHASHEPPPDPVDGAALLADTDAYWHEWISRCGHHGPWAEAVERSLIVLKALTFAPTGGIVAAPTTSLPEAIGGVRNWDYRFCWIRDATFTLDALMGAGYHDEARAWQAWLARAVAGDPSQLQIMYGVQGERRLTEQVLPWLPGFESSAPVRIGNAAKDQFQLDVYGEVVDALYQGAQQGLEAGGEAWRIHDALVEFVAQHWSDPDEGLWEVRSGRLPFTHSKVMAWVALDRAVRGIERFGRPGPLARWRGLRDRIHAEICARGYDARRGTFVRSYGADALDAALLMIPLVGFLPADDPRVVRTVDAIQRELTRDGFVLRYRTDEVDDGLPGAEGVFIMCTFWLADCLALLGRVDEARAMFERLLALRNDVGLLAEEWDPRARRLLGNFPQAFSHVSLINTASRLERRASPAEARSGA